VIGELPDQRIAFAVAQALDAQDVGGVGVERLAAGLFVEPNDGMDRRRPQPVLGFQQLVALAFAAAIGVLGLARRCAS
jgi:hypothetical protein